MRIYVSPARGQGGPAVWAGRFTAELQQRGFRVVHRLWPGTRVALCNIATDRLERAKRRGLTVGYRVAGCYLPSWFAATGQPMTDAHRAANAAIGRALQSSDVVIYQSRWAKDQLDRTLGACAGRSAVIHNGVDLGQFRPSRRTPGNTPVIGTVGVFRHAQRLETLWMISRRLPFDHRLLVIGPLTDTASRAAATKGMADPVLRQRTTFVGTIPPEQLPDLYRQMDCLVHPVIGDWCPNAVVEALASGVPVVCPTDGGTAELIGTGGIAVPSYPWRYDEAFARATATAVERVIHEHPAYARAARQRAESALGINTMVDGYLETLGVPPRATTAPRPQRPLSIPAMRKPQIAFVLYDFYIGGIESFLYRLARRLSQEFDFHFLATAVRKFAPQFTAIGATAYVPTPHALHRYLRRRRIDIFQVHNERWPVDVAKAAGVHHIIERTDGTRSCCRVSKVDLEYVVASSRQTHDMIERAYPGTPLTTIYNGIELTEVDQSPAHRFFPPGCFVIGRVSRFGRGKNIAMLIAAVQALLPRYPSLRLVLVGGDSKLPGAERHERELRRLAAGMEGSVVFTGETANPIPLIKGFDVGTCVSHPGNEGIPNSLIESMACGIPVIATNVDQIPELVEDGVNGWLIPPGDVEALQSAIVQAMDEQERRRRGLAARRTVTERFNLERTCERYRQLYRRLLCA